MIKKVEKWVVCIEGKEHEFKSKEKAIEYERSKKIEKEIDSLFPLLEKYFKTVYNRKDYSKWNSRFDKYCSDCGKHIAQYEEEQDGHDAYPGKDLLPDIKCIKFMDGWRCEKCHQKNQELFKQILENSYSKKMDVIWRIMNLGYIGINELKESGLLLDFLKAVDKWDKNKKNKNKDAKNEKTKQTKPTRRTG